MGGKEDAALVRDEGSRRVAVVGGGKFTLSRLVVARVC